MGPPGRGMRKSGSAEPPVLKITYFGVTTTVKGVLGSCGKKRSRGIGKRVRRCWLS